MMTDNEKQRATYEAALLAYLDFYGVEEGDDNYDETVNNFGESYIGEFLGMQDFIFEYIVENNLMGTYISKLYRVDPLLVMPMFYEIPSRNGMVYIFREI